MRLGVHLPQFRAPVPGPVLAAWARDAEEAGADDLWVSDHVILPRGSARPPESFHDALTVLTWAAAATQRAGLGTSVLVAPYRPPVLLAKALASLDALSGGRLVLGLASGWMEAEFAALGVPFAERGRLTDAALALMRDLWAGRAPDDPRLAGMSLRPAPSRPGGPPVWIGGDSDAGIARAVRAGDGWHTTTSDPDRLPERVEALHAALAAAGRPRAGFTLSVRLRADAARLRRVAPRLRALGVDHVLVDDPDEDPRTVRARVGAMRESVA